MTDTTLPDPEAEGTAGPPEGRPLAPDRPIFVIGHPRSGTTLLASMLGRHPAVASTPETLYLLQGRFQLAPAIAAGPEAVAARIHRTPLRRLARDRAALVADLAAAAPLTEGAVFGVLLASFARANGASRVVEKTPMHLRHVETILDWFPDARLLWILRDGRACAASLRKLSWSTSNPTLLAADWVRNMAFAEAGEARAGAALLRVRYETLTADPVAEMDRIQDFLGLPRSEAVHDHTREVDTVKAFERDWKANIGKPIMTARAEAWRDELPPAVRRTLAGIMDPTLERLGYPPEAGGSGSLAGALVRGAAGAGVGLERRFYPALKQLKERIRPSRTKADAGPPEAG